MSDYAWSVIENMSIYAAMALLVWLTKDHWWAPCWVLLAVFLNFPARKK